MTAAANLALRSWLAYRGLFSWLTPWAYVSNVVVAPLMNVLLFVVSARYAGRAYLEEHLIVGFSVVSMAWMLLGGILQSCYFDRAFGTLSLESLATGSRLPSFWARGLAHVPNALLTAATTLSVSVLAFGLDLGRASVPAVLAAMGLAALSCLAFAQGVGVVATVTRNWLVLLGLTNSTLVALTGAVIPREELGAALGWLSALLPITHGLAALRTGLYGATLAEIAPDLGAEALVGAGWFVAATAAVAAMGRLRRQRGDVDV